MKQKITLNIRLLGVILVSAFVATMLLIPGSAQAHSNYLVPPRIVAQASTPDQQAQQDPEKTPVKELPRSEGSRECNKDVAGECVSKMFDYINYAIAAIAALTGVVIIIAIIAAGIEYASAGGDPQKVASAKNRIRNAIIGLIAFGLLFGFLSWLVPGGIG